MAGFGGLISNPVGLGQFAEGVGEGPEQAALWIDKSLAYGLTSHNKTPFESGPALDQIRGTG
jgi:hypothetical protein